MKSSSDLNFSSEIEHFNAHSSTPTPVFLPSREETQTMVREKLGPKLRPLQTLYLSGERRNSDRGLSFWGGKTQTMVRVSGVFGVGVGEGALNISSEIFFVQSVGPYGMALTRKIR